MSLYPEFNPAERAERLRNLSQTGRFCCPQLQDTLLHSFGYSQIKNKLSCITGSSHATHA